MRAKYMKHHAEAGFTIIELMIATMVFSVILIGATTSTVQIGRLYYKGIIMSRTQETARNIMDTISRPIQFTGSNVRLAQPSPVNTGGIPTNALCVGDQRYTYAINAQVDSNAPIGSYTNHIARHGLWQDTLKTVDSPCTILTMTQAQPSDGNTKTGFVGKELLGQNMRLSKFDVSQNGNLWGLDTIVIYGDDDLLLPDGNNPVNCKSAAESAQWCAVSSLKTQVYKRINSEANN
jgi:prepilin-type N-terminal cleavage/methylation domain-containing protein